ncbi:MAG TPA: cytochrome ubiquinol oxidase subunit I [Acetobacteraceae bacterium]|jgi:cytochrome d ubiquinol oxidase subunit I|nr:cytochrome ubiquinol oxidase subunit I [Acetobacteraceae bacterium]
MTLDPLILSRLQFVWVIAWHILLPAFTIGTASYIALMEGMHMLTGREIYFRISSFWIKIFSVAFGMGVVSGIVMPFQFGTNWSRYAADTANVLGPLFAYEGIVAFFLEAAFLGVLLFGRNLVPRWAHFVAALMVASGTLFSAFWILAANSWMQTPAGYKIVDGKFFPVDWLAIIFNPSFPYRFFHMVCAAYITTGFVVLSVGAWLIRRGRFVLEGRLMFSGTLWLLLVLVPLQIFLGDQHGLDTLQYQPTKLAAMEGDFTTESPTPLHLFAIPDQKLGINRYDVAIPYLGSLIITHSLTKPVIGLDHWPRNDWPPVIFPFFAFRVMVGMGLLMLLLVVVGNLMRRGGRLFRSPGLLLLYQYAAPIGFIAVLAGWITTETGRQPWTVYGLLRTADSVTPSLTGWNVLVSFIGYVVAYAVIFPSGWLVMSRIVRRGPEAMVREDEAVESGRAAHPLAHLPASPGAGAAP